MGPVYGCRRKGKGVTGGQHHGHKAEGLWLGLWSSPDPGPGTGVELGGGDLGGAGDLVGIGECLPGQRLAPEDPPPAFLQVQPAGALGDEGVPDAGMLFQPGPGALAVVAGEVVGDHVDHAVGVGVMEQRYHAVMEVISGAPVAEVARRYGVSQQAVHGWLGRYEREGLTRTS
jgi:hypothetical protein